MHTYLERCRSWISCLQSRALDHLCPPILRDLRFRPQQQVLLHLQLRLHPAYRHRKIGLHPSQILLAMDAVAKLSNLALKRSVRANILRIIRPRQTVELLPHQPSLLVMTAVVRLSVSDVYLPRPPQAKSEQRGIRTVVLRGRQGHLVASVCPWLSLSMKRTGTIALMMKTSPLLLSLRSPHLEGVRRVARRAGSLYPRSSETGKTRMRRYVCSVFQAVISYKRDTCSQRTSNPLHLIDYPAARSWDAHHLRRGRPGSPRLIRQARLDAWVNHDIPPFASSRENIRCGGCLKTFPHPPGN